MLSFIAQLSNVDIKSIIPCAYRIRVGTEYECETTIVVVDAHPPTGAYMANNINILLIDE